MTTILMIAYGIFLVLVALNGHSSQLITDISQEHQFLYWIIVLLVLAALWEAPVAQDFAKSFAALIVLGFFLHNSNYKKIGANLTAILTAAPASTTTTTVTPAVQSPTNLGVPQIESPSVPGVPIQPIPAL